jgi:hypothetical protein
LTFADCRPAHLGTAPGTRFGLIIVLIVLVALVPATASAGSVPNWDRHFLLETAEGAHFEIRMGKIAERKGHT